MTEPQLFVPRTDTRLEAMRLPPVDPMMAYKDREELLRPIGGWLSDHAGEVQITDTSVWFRMKDGRDVSAHSGDWIMVRPNDIVVFSDEEFRENYTEAPTDETIGTIPIFPPGRMSDVSDVEGRAVVYADGSFKVTMLNKEHADLIRDYMVKGGLMAVSFVWLAGRPGRVFPDKVEAE